MFELKLRKNYRICGGAGNVTDSTTVIHNCNWSRVTGYPYSELARFSSVYPGERRGNIFYINCSFLIITKYVQLNY